MSQVKLADGTTFRAAPGSTLPLDLHPDFQYYAMPGESIPAVKDLQILVQTTIAQRDVNLEVIRENTPAQTTRMLERTGRSIRNAIHGHHRVHASMLRGERRGKKKWQELIDDFNIVMSDQLLRGDTMRVLIDVPKLSEDGRSAAAPIFLMRLQ